MVANLLVQVRSKRVIHWNHLLLLNYVWVAKHSSDVFYILFLYFLSSFNRIVIYLLTEIVFDP